MRSGFGFIFGFIFLLFFLSGVSAGMLNDFFKGVFKSVELSPEGKVVNITGMRLIQDSCGKVFLECTTDDWTNSIFPIVPSLFTITAFCIH